MNKVKIQQDKGKIYCRKSCIGWVRFKPKSNSQISEYIPVQHLCLLYLVLVIIV